VSKTRRKLLKINPRKTDKMIGNANQNVAKLQKSSHTVIRKFGKLRKVR